MEKPIKEKDETSKPKCFIIMPFGGWFDKYYSEIYVPAIDDAGFEAKRADDLYRPGNIVNDIWTYTKEAKVILADLTNKNPNVFYELGLAHAITKPAVLITASMDDVPFDLRSLRVIEYDKNSPDWGNILREKIKKALLETLKFPEDAIPSTFIEVSKTKRLVLSEQEKEMLDIRREIDVLRREVRSRDSSSFRERRAQITSGQATSMIEQYIKEGYEEKDIIELLEPLGLPSDWIINKIKEIEK